MYTEEKKSELKRRFTNLYYKILSIFKMICDRESDLLPRHFYINQMMEV